MLCSHCFRIQNYCLDLVQAAIASVGLERKAFISCFAQKGTKELD